MNQVVYFSMTGNTKKLARAIADGAALTAIPIKDAILSQKVDTLFIGASVYGGKISENLRGFLAKLDPALVGRVVVFGSSAGGDTSLDEIKSLLKPLGISVSNECFFTRGSFLFFNLGRPNHSDLDRARAFAREVCKNRS